MTISDGCGKRERVQGRYLCSLACHHSSNTEQAGLNMKEDIRQRRITAAGILLSSQQGHLSHK